MNKKTVSLLFLTMIITSLFVSCTDLFTTSLGTSFARDTIPINANASTSDLAKMLSDPKLMKEPEAGSAVLDAIGKKNPEEIIALNKEDKEAILKIAASISLPIDKITESIGDLTAEDSDPVKIIESILESTKTIDTAAIKTLLNDEETLKEVSPETAALACVALVAQTVKSDTGITTESVQKILEEAVINEDGSVNFGNNADTLSDETRENLEIVAKAAKNLKDAVIFGINFGDLLKSK